MRNIFSRLPLQSSPRHRHVIKSGTQLFRRLRRLPPRFHLGRVGLFGRGRQRRRRGDPAVSAGEGTDRRGEDPRRPRPQLMHGLPAQVDGGRQVHQRGVPSVLGRRRAGKCSTISSGRFNSLFDLF